MNKDVIITVLGGICIFLLFKQYGNVLPKLAKKSESTTDEPSSNDAECREAVNMIVSEKMGNQKFTSQKAYEQAKKKLFDSELEKCINS